MSLVFHCPNCGARFDVDPSLAGRKARCQRCNERTTIPAGGALRPDFRLTSEPAGAVQAGGAKGRPASWLEAVNSQVALAPLSEASLAPLNRPGLMPSALDDASSDSLYKVAPITARQTASPGGPLTKPAGALTRGYRGQVRGVAAVFRWLNETAYLLSVPFIGLLIFGVIAHNRGLAMLGAVLVVLLNIGRLVAGLANLLAIPFKESPLQGVLFLVPPFTFLYAQKHWKRLRKPVLRVVEPVLTMLVVVLAFAFVPWMRDRDAPVQASVAGRIRESVSELKAGAESKLEALPGGIEQATQKASGLIQRGGSPSSDGAGPGPAVGGDAPAADSGAPPATSGPFGGRR